MNFKTKREELKNEESEGESMQDGYGNSNPDSFPTEEEVEL